MNIKLLTEHHLEFLSLKGGCGGSSESKLVQSPHCWKSHVTTQSYVGLKALLCLFQKEIKEIGARNSNITSKLFTTKEQGTDPAIKCKSHARI